MTWEKKSVQRIQQQTPREMPTISSDLKFRGRLPCGRAPDGAEAFYVAAAPPDYRSSFTGSALPFANASHAFYNTPNRGKVQVAGDGSFEVGLQAPNAYYVAHGTVRVPPVLHLVYTVDGRRQQVALPVGRGVPFRSLTYPPSRKGAAPFYAPENPTARSQYDILMASAFPAYNIQPPNFWGNKPPR